MSKLMNIHFAGAELMTGLPEYRNGGLFIDTGVLSLKTKQEKRGIQQFRANNAREGTVDMEVVPMFSPDDDVIIEWRAVTVGFLDLLLEKVNLQLGLQGVDRLSLPQMLEAGSWKVRNSLPSCFFSTTRKILILTCAKIGRQRNGRDLETKYAVPADCYPERRHCLLDTSSFARIEYNEGCWHNIISFGVEWRRGDILYFVLYMLDWHFMIRTN